MAEELNRRQLSALPPHLKDAALCSEALQEAIDSAHSALVSIRHLQKLLEKM